MSFFQRLQNSAFTDWFLGSPSIWAYPTVLTLHTVGMAILVGASFVINLRVLQVSGLIPLHRLQPLYRFIWIGFTINLAQRPRSCSSRKRQIASWTRSST